MHDLHLADKVIKKILEFADLHKLSKVKEVSIELGVISEHGTDISSENLEFNLKTLSGETKADGAKFDIKKISDRGIYKIVEIDGE